MTLDMELLQILACPKCRGDLQYMEGSLGPEGLFCAACAVVYPIEEDIPVLLIEEAVPKALWKGKA